ncbi:hypothetical protein J5X98_15490 [Leptothermofonsia sichuanensis E412]|uniref:hypothetical protein n=1 Tax=Leptothermofonsia sichuanensis TaxID=2917832 RepID=UPI001CA629EF|nr:hypothetical protein [Leptothermofonsia sichuanensis]QZZ18857.1 hypothetical protein J5X98_15490 [Leptothermofonsia sichuanensis E412]
MSSPSDHQMLLELVVRSSHPALLEGLDVWLQLGLLSDETVRQICREQLTCPLRQPVTEQMQTDDGFISSVSDDFLEEGSPLAETTPGEPAHRFARVIQSFMAEISVLWLLFLGVFMVVVSSGVLAASQWRNVSPVRQYLILLAYTLAFWVTTILTRQSPALRLTSRMLQITTLLIIPVNFWMMDGFRLLTSAYGVTVAAIAALCLTTITILLLKPTLAEPGNTWLTAGTAIALSWLHWGWGREGFPLIATYLGTIGATLSLTYQNQVAGRGIGGGRGEKSGGSGDGEAQQDKETEDLEAVRDGGTGSFSPSLASSSSPLPYGYLAVAFGILLLIGRAVFLVQVPVAQLGLALGICGWLLCWLSRQDLHRAAWVRVGTVLLVVGWLVSVTLTPPWQAIAISGLGLWLLADNLQRSGESQYLTASFLVGLQSFWLLWRVIPTAWQQRLIDGSMQLAGADAMPLSLAGLWFFPHLLLTVGLATRLRSWQQPELAKQAERLALGLGLILAIVSAGNPLVRLVNLTLSTFVLVAVNRNRSQPERLLVYVTHGTGLAAIAAGIRYCFPNLSLSQWAIAGLVGMLLEWGFSAGRGERSRREGRGERREERGGEPVEAERAEVWRQSAWHFGLILAAMSYWFLWEGVQQAGSNLWSVSWLLTPLALTGLTYHRGFPSSGWAGWLSVFGLVVVQLLTFGSSGERLIGLGAATVLMGFNTQQLQHWLAAGLTIGFALAFAAVTTWEILGKNLTFEQAINLMAIAILVLWLLRGVLLSRRTLLADLYRQATDGWAIALTGLTLLLLTLANLDPYLGISSARWQFVSAAILVFLAIGYRIWQSLFNSSFYLLAWSLELMVMGMVALAGRSLDTLAIANLGLGLGTQVLGDWWIGWGNRGAVGQRSSGFGDPGNPAAEEQGSGREPGSPLPPPRSLLSPPSSPLPPFLSFHLIPLIYAALGFLLAHRKFTATTGLYTLAAALVGIGIGRRQPEFKPLTYLSILAFSFGTYELLVYQLAQMAEGSPGDGMVLLAALAACWTIATRLLLPWLTAYLRLTALELKAIAHLHWALGNLFLLWALFSAPSPAGEWWWVGLAAIFSTYALAMGNRRAQGMGYRVRGTERNTGVQPSIPDTRHPVLLFWTYAGILEGLITLTYGLYLLLPDNVLIEWGSAIAALVACLLYQLPWQVWGWYQTPWRSSAAVLPAVVILLTGWGSTIQSLLLGAAFYAWLAKSERQVRLSYIGVLLANWAILRLLNQYGVTEPLWYAALISASLLYGVQIDPGLKSPTERDKRHLLRSLATALLCLTAIYQAEVGIRGTPPILVSLLSTALMLGFVFAGILLRVRAFLYIGTLAFIIQVLRQLWVFNRDNPMLLWAIGIALGVALIWVAATFEVRRTQISNLVQYWAAELDGWE